MSAESGLGFCTEWGECVTGPRGAAQLITHTSHPAVLVEAVKTPPLCDLEVRRGNCGSSQRAGETGVHRVWQAEVWHPARDSYQTTPSKVFPEVSGKETFNVLWLQLVPGPLAAPLALPS